jgi:hypothetical protein
VAPGETATFGFPIHIPDGVANETAITEKFVPTTDGVALPSATFHFAVTADSRYVFTTQRVPSVAGATVEGQTLTAATGTWRPSPAALAFVWKRNGSPIANATDATYQLADSDVGRKLTVTVTATAAGFVTASTTSVATVTISSASPNSFPVGATLNSGDQIVSLNGKYRVYQRADGALILQNRFTGTTVWSNKAGGKASYTRFNDDGSLSSYSTANTRIWTSGKKADAVTAYVTSSGHFQLRNANGNVLWSVY